MFNFKFKIVLPDEYYKDEPLEGTIQASSPNQEGAISWKGDPDLLEILQLSISDYAPFVINTNVGREIFNQGHEIDPWFLKLALDKFQAKGFLTYELVEGQELLNIVPVGSNLREDENF